MFVYMYLPVYIRRSSLESPSPGGADRCTQASICPVPGNYQIRLPASCGYLRTASVPYLIPPPTNVLSENNVVQYVDIMYNIVTLGSTAGEGGGPEANLDFKAILNTDRTYLEMWQLNL